MSDDTWQKYYERTKDSPPRPLLVKAIEYVKEKNKALDLGAGALNDVRYLLSIGFNHITAVDSKPVAEKIIHHFPKDTVSYVISTFENFSYTSNTHDLISAQYALPFNPPSSFETVISNIISSLKDGGVFTGQFFGMRDEWNVENSNMTFQTREQAEKLLSGLKIISFREEEVDKKTAAGKMKHWHVFHFIAVK